MKETILLITLFSCFSLSISFKLSLSMNEEKNSSDLVTSTAVSLNQFINLQGNLITYLDSKYTLKQFHINNVTYQCSAAVLALPFDKFVIAYGSKLSVDLIDSDGRIISTFNSHISVSSSRVILLLTLEYHFIIGWSYIDQLYFILLNDDFTQIKMSQFSLNDTNNVNLMECITVTSDHNECCVSNQFICIYALTEYISFQLSELDKEHSFKVITNPIQIKASHILQSKIIQMNLFLFITCSSLADTNDLTSIFCNRLVYSHSTQTMTIDLVNGRESIEMMNGKSCYSKYNASNFFGLTKISTSLFILTCISHNNLLYQFSNIELNTNSIIGIDVGMINIHQMSFNISLIKALNNSKNGLINIFYFDSYNNTSYAELTYPTCSSYSVIFDKNREDDIDVVFYINLIAVYKQQIYMRNNTDYNEELYIVFISIPDGVGIRDNVLFDYPFTMSVIINKPNQDGDVFVLKYYLLFNRNLVSDQCSIEIKMNSKGKNEADNCDDLDLKQCVKCPIGLYPLQANKLTLNCFSASLMIEQYYYDTILNRFDLCYKSCRRCFGKGTEDNHQCSQCLTGYVFEPKKNNCYEEHSLLLIRRNLSGSIIPLSICYSSCSSCTQIGNETYHHCTECSKNFFPIRNPKSQSQTTNCYNPFKEVVAYYYFDLELNKYQQCSNSCLTCYDSPLDTDTNCIQCNPNYIQDPYDNTNCFPSCEPFYWYMNYTKYSCTKDFECLEDKPIFNNKTHQCIDTCPDGLYQLLNTCVIECPENTIIDNTYYKCIAIPSIITIETVAKNIIYLPRQQLLQGKGFVLQIYESSHDNIQEIKTIALSHNLTYIDFKECLRALKYVWNVNQKVEHLIAKFEFKRQNETTNQVEYMIFTQMGQKLDLSICNELNITVNYALILSNDSQLFLDMAQLFWNKSGIDIYNRTDSFFNDYCLPFTSEDNTDVIISERRIHYYKNISFCEENCTYLSIDLDNLRIDCICPIKPTATDDIKHNVYTYYAKEKEDELTSSNYYVITCYQQVFNLRILKINLGNYIFLVLVLMELAIMIKCAIRSTKAVLDHFVNIKQTMAAPPKKKSKKTLNLYSLTNNNMITMAMPQKKKATVESFKTASTNESTQNKFFMNKTTYNNFILSPSDHYNISINGNKLLGLNHQRKKAFELISSIKTDTIKGDSRDVYVEYTQMPYEKALNRDKRTILKMYIDLIYSKHIVLCLLNKNNIIFYKSIKLSVFVLSTATDFFFNAFFYSDEYIKRRYISKGNESFWITLPKSIFSYLITALITIAMEYLTETKIPFNTQSKRFKEKLYRKCNTYLRELRLKLVVYFIIDWILMIFYWYYVSAFCGVYQNSQISWLTSTLLSFSISLVTPFFTSLGIGLLRYLALFFKVKWVFRISNIIWTLI